MMNLHPGIQPTNHARFIKSLYTGYMKHIRIPFQNCF